MKSSRYHVYILSSLSGTLYIGFTNNLQRRIQEHKSKLVPGFTKQYNIDRLVYYEEYSDVVSGLAREKQLKKWSRAKKLALVESINPARVDLSLEM